MHVSITNIEDISKRLNLHQVIRIYVKEGRLELKFHFCQIFPVFLNWSAGCLFSKVAAQFVSIFLMLSKTRTHLKTSRSPEIHVLHAQIVISQPTNERFVCLKWKEITERYKDRSCQTKVFFCFLETEPELFIVFKNETRRQRNSDIRNVLPRNLGCQTDRAWKISDEKITPRLYLLCVQSAQLQSSL